jgi:hypothetical protein
VAQPPSAVALGWTIKSGLRQQGKLTDPSFPGTDVPGYYLASLRDCDISLQRIPLGCHSERSLWFFHAKNLCIFLDRSKLETSKLICCHPERLFSNAKDLRFADRHDQPKKSHSKVIKTYARKNGIKDDPTHG